MVSAEWEYSVLSQKTRDTADRPSRFAYLCPVGSQKGVHSDDADDAGTTGYTKTKGFPLVYPAVSASSALSLLIPDHGAVHREEARGSAMPLGPFHRFECRWSLGRTVRAEKLNAPAIP